CARSNSNFDCW
nr:immunoglobulin heavy chain junction region [Macaca mulatta]MOW89999.1 immunoglobulin heavy chain junction region [Macaca mulatta]